MPIFVIMNTVKCSVSPIILFFKLLSLIPQQVKYSYFCIVDKQPGSRVEAASPHVGHSYVPGFEPPTFSLVVENE